MRLPSVPEIIGQDADKLLEPVLKRK